MPLSSLLSGGAVFLDNAEGSAANPIADMAGRMLLGVALFALVMYVIYIIYRRFLSGGGLRKSKNMRVMEITSVGPGSTIQLVKVSEEYFLIGVTKNQITFLTKIEAPPADEGGAVTAGMPVIPFENYLKRFFNKSKGHDE